MKKEEGKRKKRSRKGNEEKKKEKKRTSDEALALATISATCWKSRRPAFGLCLGL